MSGITDLPLVSVLVPAYNHATYITSCLQSIADEDYPNLELLVLDDGSKDETFALATAWFKAHLDRFVRVKIFRQDNQGVCAALNRLVAESEGEFVAILASDDQMVRGGLKARVKALAAHPSWMAVIGYAAVMNSDGNDVAANAMVSLYRSDIRMLHHPRNISIELILHWSVPGPVFMARRLTYDPGTGVGAYDEALPVEDRDFYLRLLARGALGYIDAQVGRYRIHDTNVSRNRFVIPRISKALMDSCIKNLSSFSGFPRYCLTKHLAYLQASETRYRSPSIWPLINLIRWRLFIEALLRGSRLLNHMSYHLESVGRLGKG